MALNKHERYIPMSETMFYILLSLRQERHGYGILQHVKTLTKIASRSAERLLEPWQT